MRGDGERADDDGQLRRGGDGDDGRSAELHQAGAQVIGNDAVVAFSGTCGAFELNTMLPVTACNLLQALELLAAASRVFARRCVAGLEADARRCEGYLEQSLSLATALAPALGYDRAAEIAKTAFKTNRTVRAVALEISGLDKATLDRLLDPGRQTEPSRGP